MKEFNVKNLKTQNKLIYIIQDKYPNLSSSMLHKAFRNKDIKVNGKRITDQNYMIKNGDNIQVYINDMLLYGFPKELEIVYEDDNILAVYKPQGLLSNNEEKVQTEPTFEDFVKAQKGENSVILHRLDRNTSGVLLFSKNEASYNELLVAFRDGYINKEYIAYVDGSKFSKKDYHFEKYLLKDEKTAFSKIYDTQVTGSQKIITDVHIEKMNKELDYTIVRVQIHTGKTHQIRALLSSISHPIIGDSKYGKNDINKKFKKYKQMLYAVKYTFNFPKDSFLNYLNSKTIELDKKYYTVVL